MSGVTKALLLSTAWVISTVVSSIIAAQLLNDHNGNWLEYLENFTLSGFIQTAIGAGLFIFLPVASMIDFKFHLIVSEHRKPQFLSDFINCGIYFFILSIIMSLYFGRLEEGYLEIKSVLLTMLLCLVIIQKSQTYLTPLASLGREL